METVNDLIALIRLRFHAVRREPVVALIEETADALCFDSGGTARAIFIAHGSCAQEEDAAGCGIDKLRVTGVEPVSPL
jgi:hypothetical protein